MRSHILNNLWNFDSKIDPASWVAETSSAAEAAALDGDSGGR